ncbi:MAG: sulfur oxidation c-type cytochrome SoxX [Rhodobacteraceae bacterium]|nr:sulfur oxidation c-type cytochrome SoxX [Paracoccaceae bacterium]
MAADRTVIADNALSYVVEDLEIKLPLADVPGDPVRGELLVRDASRATCLICHDVPIEGEPDPGNIGPPLAGVALRYTAGELRLRLVDPKQFNPDTIMPSYLRTSDLYEVAQEYRDQSIYSAQDVEDVVAYLLTLDEL